MKYLYDVRESLQRMLPEYFRARAAQVVKTNTKAADLWLLAADKIENGGTFAGEAGEAARLGRIDHERGKLAGTVAPSPSGTSAPVGKIGAYCQRVGIVKEYVPREVLTLKTEDGVKTFRPPAGVKAWTYICKLVENGDDWTVLDDTTWRDAFASKIANDGEASLSELSLYIHARYERARNLKHEFQLRGTKREIEKRKRW